MSNCDQDIGSLQKNEHIENAINSTDLFGQSHTDNITEQVITETLCDFQQPETEDDFIVRQDDVNTGHINTDDTNTEHVNTDDVMNIDVVNTDDPKGDAYFLTQNEKLAKLFDKETFQELYIVNQLDTLSYLESVINSLRQKQMKIEEILEIVNSVTNGNLALIKHTIDCYANANHKIYIPDLLVILKFIIDNVPPTDPVDILLQIIKIYIYNKSKFDPLYEACYKNWIRIHYHHIARQSPKIQYLYFQIDGILNEHFDVSEISFELFDECYKHMKFLDCAICDVLSEL